MTESQAIRNIFETDGYTILIQEKLKLKKETGRKYATVLKVQWKKGRLPLLTKQKLLKAFGYELVRESEYRLMGL